MFQCNEKAQKSDHGSYNVNYDLTWSGLKAQACFMIHLCDPPSALFCNRLETEIRS